MLIAEHSVVAKASRQDVWNVWSDVSNWPNWDKALKRVTLHDGHEFAVGSSIHLEPAFGPPVDVKVRELMQYRKYGNTSPSPFGGTINTYHEVTDLEDDKVTITHRITADIPEAMEGVFIEKIWAGIQQGWPHAVENVKAMAEELAGAAKV